MPNTWTDWLHRTSRNESTRTIASRVGKSHTTVQRWLHNGPTPEAVFRLIIAYGADPIEAFVTAGWMTQAEAEQFRTNPDLSAVPTDILTGELHQRAVRARAAHQNHRR